MPECIKFSKGGGGGQDFVYLSLVSYIYLVFIAKIPETSSDFKIFESRFSVVLLPEVPGMKYSFQNTSSLQYFMLLTSGG